MAQRADDNPHVRSAGDHSEGEAHGTTHRPLGGDGDTGCLPKKRKSRSHGTNTEVKRRRKQE